VQVSFGERLAVFIPPMQITARSHMSLHQLLSLISLILQRHHQPASPTGHRSFAAMSSLLMNTGQTSDWFRPETDIDNHDADNRCLRLNRGE